MPRPGVLAVPCAMANDLFKKGHSIYIVQLTMRFADEFLSEINIKF